LVEIEDLDPIEGRQKGVVWNKRRRMITDPGVSKWGVGGMGPVGRGQRLTRHAAEFRPRTQCISGDFPQGTCRTSARAASPARGRSRQRRLFGRDGEGMGSRGSEEMGLFVPSPSQPPPW